MYLIGRFQRCRIFDENPLNEVEVVNNIHKEHLVFAKEDEDYQIININTLEYYDPRSNTWKKIKKA